MKPRHRSFQYSLRSFLVLMTALAVWLGVAVNRAREQREAVKAIEAINGDVFYDWQLDWTTYGGDIGPWVDLNGVPKGPFWLRRLIGDEVFQDVALVCVDEVSASPPPTESDILETVEHLKHLRGLRLFDLNFPLDSRTQSKIKAALPDCEVRFHSPG